MGQEKSYLGHVQNEGVGSKERFFSFLWMSSLSFSVKQRFCKISRKILAKQHKSHDGQIKGKRLNLEGQIYH